MTSFFQWVYSVVKRIPPGKVTTYGEIATQLKVQNSKLKIDPRMVGWALHANKDSEVPCHRVVDRDGRLAPNFAIDGPEEQRGRLLDEGVEFVDKMHVNLSTCFWTGSDNQNTLPRPATRQARRKTAEIRKSDSQRTR